MIELPIAVVATVIVGWSAGLFGVTRWVVDRSLTQAEHRMAQVERRVEVNTDAARITGNDLLRLRTELAREYVRHEDFVRFGVALDAKLDRISDNVSIRFDRLSEKVEFLKDRQRD